MIIDVHTHIFESLDVFQKTWLESYRAHKKSQLGDKEYDPGRKCQDIPGNLRPLIMIIYQGGKELWNVGANVFFCLD